MSARRLFVLCLLLLAGVVLPSAAGGGAVGGGGDDPPQSPPSTPPVGNLFALAQSRTLTFAPSDDTYSSGANPSTVHGTLTYLRIDGDPVRRAYLRFPVAGLVAGSERIARATLRLYARTSHSTGYDVLSVVDNAWTERTLTLLNAPMHSPLLIGTSGPIRSGTWTSSDVTAAITGNGAYSFALTTARTSSLELSSKEASSARVPQLVVQAAPNNAPLCADAARVTRQGVAVSAEGLCSDSDGDAISYSIATAPAHGTLTVTGSGATYLPELAATHGTPRNDAFTLRASDRWGAETTVNVTVRVDPRPGDLTLPARAAFYYAWFPEGWKQQGFNPFTRYTPAYQSPFYSSSAVETVREHVRALDYGNFDVGIASWWGPGGKFEAERIPLLLTTTSELGSDLKWTLYYEAEGRGNPSVDALQADFAYIHERYATHPSFARVDGKPVLFVYSVDDLSCELTARWAQATAGDWYVVLNVFPGFATCPVQPDAWHQYGPAQAVRSRLPHSYNVSPGFWRPDEATPRLARDLTRFDQNIRDMVASGARWHLVTSFNEWGEGTPVENAQEWLSPSGYGRYLDVLHAHRSGGGS